MVEDLPGKHQVPRVKCLISGLIDEPIFTVYYEKRGGQDGVDGGQITFGGVDTDHCGEVEYIDLTRAEYWEFMARID